MNASLSSSSGSIVGGVVGFRSVVSSCFDSLTRAYDSDLESYRLRIHSLELALHASEQSVQQGIEERDLLRRRVLELETHLTQFSHLGDAVRNIALESSRRHPEEEIEEEREENKEKEYVRSGWDTSKMMPPRGTVVGSIRGERVSDDTDQVEFALRYTSPSTAIRFLPREVTRRIEERETNEMGIDRWRDGFVVEDEEEERRNAGEETNSRADSSTDSLDPSSVYSLLKKSLTPQEFREFASVVRRLNEVGSSGIQGALKAMNSMLGPNRGNLYRIVERLFLETY